MKQKTSELLHRIELLGTLALGVVLLGMFLSTKQGFIGFEGNKVTGFVSADTVTQSIDIPVTKSTAFELSSSTSFLLTSFRLSGTVTGSGVVRVMLDDGKEEYLVYTNEKEQRVGNLITGSAVQIVPVGDPVPDAQPTAGMVSQSGKFYNECKQTCFLKLAFAPGKTYHMRVQLGEGTTVALTQLSYTSAK